MSHAWLVLGLLSRSEGCGGRLRAGLLVALVCLGLYTAAPLLAQRQSSTEGPALELRVRTDRVEYRLDDDIRLECELVNVSRSPLTVWGQLAWGLAGGLSVHVADAAGAAIPSRTLDHDMLVPSTLTDRDRFVVLMPSHYLGTSRVDPITEFVDRPGTYSIEVEYRSPVPGQFGQGPKFWSRERGPIRSAKLRVIVRD